MLGVFCFKFLVTDTESCECFTLSLQYNPGLLYSIFFILGLLPASGQACSSRAVQSDAGGINVAFIAWYDKEELEL